METEKQQAGAEVFGGSCPECAKKHLRAALAWATDTERWSGHAAGASFNSIVAMVSDAWVLLGESLAYPRHRDLALGRLTQAEESATVAGLGFIVSILRECRLHPGSPGETMVLLEGTELVNPVVGHMCEAHREGGVPLPEVIDAKYVTDNFDRLIKEVETPKPEEGKEGEQTMACAKKAAAKGGKTVAKKAAGKPVAKKAACKGKCKK